MYVNFRFVVEASMTKLTLHVVIMHSKCFACFAVNDWRKYKSKVLSLVERSDKSLGTIVARRCRIQRPHKYTAMKYMYLYRPDYRIMDCASTSYCVVHKQHNNQSKVATCISCISCITSQTVIHVVLNAQNCACFVEVKPFVMWVLLNYTSANNKNQSKLC